MVDYDFYIDIHCHPTTKPSMLKGVDSPWDDLDKALPGQRHVRTAKLTSSDFTKALNANVRVMGAFLITPERYVYSKLLTSPQVLARYFGMELSTLRTILCTQPFKLLKKELAFLKRNLQDPRTGTAREAVIARDFPHLEQILANPNQMALLLGVEGAHNLGFEYSGPDFPIETRLYNFKNRVEPVEEATFDLVDDRVAWMRKQHVFWLTLNHFVYNHLATMPKAIELTGWKKLGHNPFRSLQAAGLYRGLTFLGQYMAEQCMKNRIVLDVKHCDAVSRAQVYRIAERMGQPVVASHVAFSGKETNLSGLRLLQAEDMPADRLKSRERFNPWDINLHNDDILAIHRLGGLMGLILDERILASLPEQRRLRAAGEPIQFLAQQILYAYQVLRKAGIPAAECFDSLCIGSDHDGFIEPIQTICTLEDYRHLPERDGRFSQKLDSALYQALMRNREVFRESGLEPDQIVRKILRENALAFLRRWFVPVETQLPDLAAQPEPAPAG